MYIISILQEAHYLLQMKRIALLRWFERIDYRLSRT